MPVELFGGTGALGKAASGLAKKSPASTGGGAAEGFADALGRLLDGVEQTAGEANVAIGNMVEKNGEVHDAMIALQRAEMSLQLTVQIRNKFVNAYNEIMRMPI
jgi:flagellar hook-basal body complex protein FliE